MPKIPQKYYQDQEPRKVMVIPRRPRGRAGPPQTLTSGPVWVEKKIKVTMVGGGRKKISAMCLGKVAVHYSVDGEEFGWRVTSITTGQALVMVKTKEDALRAGEFLWDNVCLALSRPTEEAILERMPQWVINWCRRCCDMDAWCDPGPFMGES